MHCLRETDENISAQINICSQNKYAEWFVARLFLPPAVGDVSHLWVLVVDQPTADSLDLEWRLCSILTSWFAKVFVIVAMICQLVVWHVLKCEMFFFVLFFSKLSTLDIWGCRHNFSDIMIVSSYFTHSVYSSCRTKWHGEVCGLFWKLSFYTHLHIYKKFNPTRIQQKQSELHKREFLTQTHPQQKQCTTLSHYAKS